jgi:hypothetical protein
LICSGENELYGPLMVGPLLEMRLTDPDLDFWVDVRLRHVGESWVAVADLASTPEIAAAVRPDLALILALWPLGAEVATRLATPALARIDAGLTHPV